MEPSPIDFRARPFVCGALGVVAPDRLARLHRAVPGLTTVHEATGVVLLANAPLSPYRVDGPVRAWAFGDRSPAPTDDWQAAAVAAEAPGLVDDGDQVVLHSGALGFIDLFTRYLGDALWFASRIEPLVSLDPAPLDVDWEAWASVIVFHCPSGDRTPFQAVRRLQGSRMHILDRATRRIRSERWSPPWHGLDSVDQDAGDPVEIMERLRDTMRGMQPVPYALALSGGYDSRLVAIAARDVGTDMTAWSTSKDDGRDDVPITRDLAALLDLELRYVDPSAVPYPVAGEEVRDRTGGMVAMHTWMGPLGAALRSNGQPVLTDTIGGVLIGGANITAEMLVQPPGRARLIALRTQVERPPIIGKTLAETAVPWIMDTAHASWLAAVRHLEGDANGLVLSTIETRDTRGIITMPMWLFGPEVRVETPTSRPEMILAALAVGIRRKARGAFSQEVLAAADPVAGTLRTSHDRRPALAGVVGHKATPEALAWLRADIEQARAVPGLVPDGLLRYLELGRWAGPNRRDALLRRPRRPRPGAFEGAQMTNYARLGLPLAHLGAWIEGNRHRLSSIEPPWRTTIRRR